MFPVVLPGARLRFVPCAASGVRVGDVVLVERARALVAHRVVERTSRGLVTRGDAHAHTDPLVDPFEVLGRADGVPLAWAQLPLPRPMALPLNRMAGWSARRVMGLRQRTSTAVDRLWRSGSRVVWIRSARRTLQQFVVRAWDGSSSARELVLRAGLRPSAETIATWQRAADGDARAAAWVALDGETPVAWLLAAQGGEGEPHALRLWVARSYRGLGVASSLIDRAIAAAEERGWPALRIECREPMAAWLRRRGFADVGLDGTLVALERIIEPR